MVITAVFSLSVHDCQVGNKEGKRDEQKDPHNGERTRPRVYYGTRPLEAGFSPFVRYTQPVGSFDDDDRPSPVVVNKSPGVVVVVEKNIFAQRSSCFFQTSGVRDSVEGFSTLWLESETSLEEDKKISCQCV